MVFCSVHNLRIDASILSFFYKIFLIYSDTEIPFGSVRRGFLREIEDYIYVVDLLASRLEKKDTLISTSLSPSVLTRSSLKEMEEREDE